MIITLEWGLRGMQATMTTYKLPPFSLTMLSDLTRLKRCGIIIFDALRYNYTVHIYQTRSDRHGQEIEYAHKSQ